MTCQGGHLNFSEHKDKTMKRHIVENKTWIFQKLNKQTIKQKTPHITGLHGFNKGITSSNPTHSTTRCKGFFGVHFAQCRQEVL